MKESLLKLAKLLAEDEKFLKEFSSKKSVDEQYNFAQKSVKGYTKEEFAKFLDELEKSYELKRDISPEEMEQVSGGANAKTKAAAMAMLALTAAGGISNLASMPLGTSAMMRASETTTANEAATCVIRDYLQQYGRAWKWLTYENCSDTDVENGPGRAQLTRFLGIIKEDKAQEERFKNALKEFLKPSSLKWFRSPGRLWTGWKFKNETISSGDSAESKVILWLQKMFNDGYYLYYKLGEWGLATNTSFTSFDDLFGSFQGEYGGVTKEEYNEALKVLIQEANLHRALRGALAANGMIVEANSVMGTV